MAYVYPPEVPTGVIDGSNKTFTTAQTLYEANYIFVDGAVYEGSVTFPGSNQFVLADAPTSSVSIAYYTAPTILSGAGGTLQLSTVKNAFTRLKKDLADVDDTLFIEWCNYINNFAYRHIAGIDPQRFMQASTITTVVGTQAYYLPTDFRDIQEFENGLYDSLDKSGNRFARTGPYQNTQGYYIEGTRIYITPVPTQIVPYYLRYTPNPPVLTALTDYFISPITFEYLLYVVDALDVMYGQWDEDPSSEGLSDQRFVRLLDELSRNVKKEPSAYGIPDFSTTF